uniref:Uncharacterized protein n=1 Tax=Anguilla anguilla TaxID=7936 RepID=A0A0E9SNQ9_ANGAN
MSFRPVSWSPVVHVSRLFSIGSVGTPPPAVRATFVCGRVRSLAALLLSFVCSCSA